MKITAALLSAIAGGAMTASRKANIASIIAGLVAMGEEMGLLVPHRAAHFVAQIAHESGRFIHDKEVWDGKGAQARYDTRTDLGNTAAVDGDGKLYRGRSAMQLTGKANYTEFRNWCWAQGLKAPDFVAEPDRVNEDPWEGLVPIWYWSTRNLNRYADQEDGVEMITRKINGGTNGLDDRIALYVRSALVILGRKLEEGAVRKFQSEAGLTPDDIAGPATRKALHAALVAVKVAAPAPIVLVEPIITRPALPTVTPMPDAPIGTPQQYFTLIQAMAAAGIAALEQKAA